MGTILGVGLQQLKGLLSVLTDALLKERPKEANELTGQIAFVSAVHRLPSLLSALASWMRTTQKYPAYSNARWQLACALASNEMFMYPELLPVVRALASVSERKKREIKKNSGRWVTTRRPKNEFGGHHSF